MTTQPTPDLAATSDNRLSREAYAIAQRIRDIGGAGGTMVEVPFEALHNELALLLRAGRLAQELTALLAELYPHNGTPSPVEQLKEVIEQSLGYSEAFDRGRALERQTSESLRAALAEKEAENERLRDGVRRREAEALEAASESDELRATLQQVRDELAKLLRKP